MRVWQWTVTAIAIYLIALLVTLPARQVLPHLPLPASVQVQGVSGTVWQGKAQQVWIDGLPIHGLEWQISPWHLLIGQARVSLKAGNARDSEEVSLSGPLAVPLWGEPAIEAESLELYLPTDLVIAKLPLPLPVNAGGRFKVSIDTLQYAGRCQQLQGKGQWLNASVAGTRGPIALGNFDAQLMCDDGSVMIGVRPPNEFGLTADATVSPELQFSVIGRFKPADNLPEEVHQAAAFFGKTDAEGYYAINF
ncbi:type II secretion system protein N [Aestuariibacter halophilus]|uniref:Type II secretion system protein N n=1 Tax=Fluctibacter halophilus TaxID=226011 RepID=A0ABS8G9C2_9ALTE|nr:type II secretion system protein N [Aestuariibacter halophilus]MCC2617043.1 type II secretion system protein N [Aestuariibacter halophilus]